jgi:TfoX/Sxy family transcriptional regulator of competence genes
MAYDEELAERVRAVLAERVTLLDERKMFGGLTFMVEGHMCCGVLGEDLMLRLGPEAADEALEEEHLRPMDFTGRPMPGMVFAGPKAVDDDADLARWLERALEFNASLPPRV